jgi:hypothetical protein
LGRNRLGQGGVRGKTAGRAPGSGRPRIAAAGARGARCDPCPARNRFTPNRFMGRPAPALQHGTERQAHTERHYSERILGVEWPGSLHPLSLSTMERGWFLREKFRNGISGHFGPSTQQPQPADELRDLRRARHGLHRVVHACREGRGRCHAASAEGDSNSTVVRVRPASIRPCLSICASVVAVSSC